MKRKRKIEDEQVYTISFAVVTSYKLSKINKDPLSIAMQAAVNEAMEEVRNRPEFVDREVTLQCNPIVIQGETVIW